MKTFFYILIGIIGMIMFVNLFTAEYDEQVKITLMDERTNVPVKIESISTVPGYPIKSDESLAGEGSYVYSTDEFVYGLVIAKSEGFKTKYTFIWGEAGENIKIYLKPDDNYEEVMKKNGKWIEDEKPDDYKDEKENKKEKPEKENNKKDDKEVELELINVK